MNYTQAQIDRANAVSLEDFLRTQGETLIKSGREYRWKEHDSLTVRGNKWFRHSQSKGGYPIDFVMEFYGKSFPEAVQLLTGESAEGQSEASTAPPTAFHLPLHNRTADRAIQYLCESRGLNKTLVEAFLLSGDIYEDAKRHNVVFVGRDRSGTPRYAHVRGTADPFRQDIAGSDKSYPFHYEGNGNQLFVFEAPIDLLSFICLYPQDWQTRSYLALGGVSGKALDRFLSERKDTRKVFLCLDSDTAGSEACTRLAQDIPGEIARHSPCPGKERLERCSPSAKGHSQPQIHSRDNHAARAAHRPTCSHAPHGRCGADERGLAMVSLYPLWKADDHTGQPRRGQDLLCHASCGGLHQPKAFTRYGVP